MALPSLGDTLHPGPKDPSLLTQQDNHISSHIWSGQERLLRARQRYVRGPKPPESILTLLKIAGFGYVAQIEKFDIDICLISALVERWRPETCTFHLPYGECTITLEDVALQLGVAVDGDAVTGLIADDWPTVCQELLGAVPPKNAWDGQTVQLSWFVNRFSKLPVDASPIVVRQYTRAYIMRLIGSLLMPDKLGTRVHLMYLPLLRDLSKVAHYSWGSAILACLYREMCHATKINSIEIGGCLVLLQAWAWDRMPSIAPQIDRLSEDQGFPFARRWSNCNKITENSNLGVSYYRFSLDQLDVHQFIWTPYASPNVRRCIPEDPGEVCYAMVPLICCAIIEWHHPDRVMRQFGLQQSIPQPPTNMDRLREVDMRGRGKVYLLQEGKMWINLWMQRRERLIQGHPFHGYLDEISDYMRWYLDVTRRWISREDAFVGTMVIGVRNILRFALSETPTPTTRINIIQTCNDMLNVSQKYHPLSISSIIEAARPTQEFSRPGDNVNVPHKQPVPMGFASYSQRHNPFSFSHQSQPMGSAPYPSSSYHVPHTASFASSHQQSSLLHPSHSIGTPAPMYTANPGTTFSTITGGAHPHMVHQKSMPPPYHPTMPSTETEDEDESGDDFESEDYSESDNVPTLRPTAGTGGKGWGMIGKTHY